MMAGSARTPRLLCASHRIRTALALCGVLAGAPGHGAVIAVTDLVDMSLEQLGNIIVTSVSRREQPLGSAAASIYVISAEDIRRSGATSIPEALRLAPNLHVARADTNQYEHGGERGTRQRPETVALPALGMGRDAPS